MDNEKISTHRIDFILLVIGSVSAGVVGGIYVSISIVSSYNRTGKLGYVYLSFFGEELLVVIGVLAGIFCAIFAFLIGRSFLTSHNTCPKKNDIPTEKLENNIKKIKKGKIMANVKTCVKNFLTQDTMTTRIAGLIFMPIVVFILFYAIYILYKIWMYVLGWIYVLFWK